MRNVVSATLNLTASPPFRVLTVLGFPDALLRRMRCHWRWSMGRSDWRVSIKCWWTSCAARAGVDATRSTAARRWISAGGDGRMECGGGAGEGRRACARLQTWPVPPVAHICTPEEAASVWYVRESALGRWCLCQANRTLGGMGRCGCSAGKLGDYLRSILRSWREYGYSSPLYGHYGQGCVHMRINFDFRSEKGCGNSVSSLIARQMWC